ncbi:hypothetical protein [Acetobacter conturbans]|uniref:hypothetical protein n=1 Tax=Acetobacter conturbans TaxID=1737472 RepID=UPI001569BF43|nr:hypothetical protein [Acetobacter conturbans]
MKAIGLATKNLEHYPTTSAVDITLRHAVQPPGGMTEISFGRQPVPAMSETSMFGGLSPVLHLSDYGAPSLHGL